MAASSTYGDEIRGQYCLARLNITQFYSKVKQRHEELGRINYKQVDPEFFELGVCVPSTCSADKTDELLKQVIAHFYGNDMINLENTMVQEKWCKYDAPIEFRGVDIFAMYVVDTGLKGGVQKDLEYHRSIQSNMCRTSK